MKWSTDNDFGTDVPIEAVSPADVARVLHMAHKYTKDAADLPNVLGALFGMKS